MTVASSTEAEKKTHHWHSSRSNILGQRIYLANNQYKSETKLMVESQKLIIGMH